MTDIRVLEEYVEAVSSTDAAPRRVQTSYVESLTVSAPPRRVQSFHVESLTVSVVPGHMQTMYVEVLTPSQLVFPFKGWGAPI